MVVWLAFYFALSLTSAAVLYPMLRMPRPKLGRVPEVMYAEVPVATYDSRGLC